MKKVFFVISLFFCFNLALAQQISPSGMYGAAGNVATGNVDVHWVLGPVISSNILSPFPVRLISFKGYAGSLGEAWLEWRTTEETNNKGFEIQKSTDGKHFEAIGWVDGGNQAGEEIYTFSDSEFSTTSYYRLKQIDFDSAYTLSRIISLIPENESLDRFNAYPNPTSTGEIYITLPDRALSMSLTDKNGRVLSEQKNPGHKQTLTLPATGLFMLRIQNAIGERTIKLVKQ
jgi:hypothetical protein